MKLHIGKAPVKFGATFILNGVKYKYYGSEQGKKINSIIAKVTPIKDEKENNN